MKSSEQAVLPRKFYTVAEIAKIMQVSTRLGWRWVAAGKLKVRRFGARTIRVAVEDFEAFQRGEG